MSEGDAFVGSGDALEDVDAFEDVTVLWQADGDAFGPAVTSSAA